MNQGIRTTRWVPKFQRRRTLIVVNQAKPSGNMSNRIPRQRLPCALAFGGLDPGGGAGILADTRAFERAGAFPCAVATCLTTQSTRGLVRVHAIHPAMWLESAERVLLDQHVRAIKIGALASKINVTSIASFIRRSVARIPVVLDTPKAPSLGDTLLLNASAWQKMVRDLFPLAALVTVNRDEAALLTHHPVRNANDAKRAVVEIGSLGPKAVLLKGGHLQGDPVDTLWIDGRIHQWTSKRLPLGPTHGTGCLLASLVAGRLATHTRTNSNGALVEAVQWARRQHQRMLATPLDVGGTLAVFLTSRNYQRYE